MKSSLPAHHTCIPPSIFFTIALLGLWLIASPATFAFQSVPLTYNNYLCGLLLLYLGEKGRRHPLNEKTHLAPRWIWAIAFIGIWLQAAPLIFWAPKAATYLNDTFVGCWLIALAITIHPLPGEYPSTQGAIPPGWSYNPSSWVQRVPIAFLAFVCWMISRYLSAYQLGYIDTVWDPFFSPGTKNVLESSVSHAFPVSDAGLGALAYTIEFFATCQGSQTRWRTAPWLVFVFGILVVPVSLVSAILIILQPLVVGTWCTLCLITALCMLTAIPFAISEVYASIQYLRSKREQGALLYTLLHGGACSGETKDRRTPSIHCSLFTILRSALSGISFPWNLVLCALCGALLLPLPSILSLHGILFALDPILGALVVMSCTISFAQCTRKTRWLNLLFAALLLIGALFSKESWNVVVLHGLFSGLIALLSIRQGEIKESFDLQA